MSEFMTGAILTALSAVAGVAWPWSRGRKAVEPIEVPDPADLEDHMLQVALDAKTRFPCVRLGGGPWVMVLPITKLQVEQFVAAGGWGRAADARWIGERLARMEQPAAGLYPATVSPMRRGPLRGFSPRNAVGVLATNLTLWANPDELSAQPPRIPTPTSEWGEYLAWMDAGLPDRAQVEQMRRDYVNVSSQKLLRAIVKTLPAGCPAVVRRLLAAVGESVDPASRGLPFASAGVWEVIDQTQTQARLSQGGIAVGVSHPVAVGQTSLWPYLPTADQHVLLQPALPMVGVRPLPRQVTDAYELCPVEGRRKTTARVSATPAPMPAPRKLKAAVEGPTTMEARCPLCYGVIDAGLWKSKGVIWCAEVRVKEGGTTRTQRVHTPDRPKNIGNPNWAEVSAELISADYRAVAGPRPELVRPVLVSGFSQEGKTTFLLGLTGTLFYPDGNDAFSRMFPGGLSFRRTLGSMAPINGGGHLSLFRSLEGMWIDGLLPLPNPIERALSSPIIFSTGGANKLVTIINDVAGEAMGPELAHTPVYPHVPLSRDIIYVVRASEINNSFLKFEHFAAGLAHGLLEKRCVDRRGLNLIVAVSQCDRLQMGSGADLELLDLVMQPPCLLPAARRAEDFTAYLDGMARVHAGLRDHLKERIPNLVSFAEDTFGSVRYSGFSAFGNHPLPQALADRPDCNGCLAVVPRPVRVADPLLWILRDQGLFG